MQAIDGVGGELEGSTQELSVRACTWVDGKGGRVGWGD